MTKYWKAIAACAASLLTTGAALGFLPPEYLEPENQANVIAGLGAIYTFATTVAVWRFPPNTG